jgi:hypothetical protein
MRLLRCNLRHLRDHRRRSSTVRRLCARAAVCTLFATSAAHAQTGISTEGAVFLLLPLGAKTVASGQSIARNDPGVEQLYWNPGGIAHATRAEFGFNYGKFFAGPLVSVGLVKPLGRAGVIGGAVAVLDFGSQQSTDLDGNIVGMTSQQAYILSATYAATFGSRVGVGITFKSARFVANCSGQCRELTEFHVSSSAIDAGVQARLLREDDLVLAAAIRHVGQDFQVNDAPQADPMPSRVQIGASYRLRMLEDDLQGAQVHVNFDLIDRLLDPGAVAPRFGVRVEWKEFVGVRAGYVGGSGEGTGVGVGVGFVAGNVGVDIAQSLARESSVTGGTTYLSVRYRW